ncbi:MAG: 5-methyltetrahydrofolate--homocysteine methyltransferase [Planctomycetota bacterium]|nr:MAG: 5-methyltetrahydrofolate--homocysteine methyltransferase [Planctomycetota bacterium]
MTKKSIVESAKERILVLDGAMGTMLQRHKLEEEDFKGEIFIKHHKLLKGNNDLLAITRPKIVEGVHDAYFEVGCDIATTNSFSGTTIAQADYELEDYIDEINFAAAQCARKSADRFTEKTPDQPRYVAGALGPTNRTASMSPDVNDPGMRLVTFENLRKAYKQQAIGLIKGGVDVLLVETVFDTLNCKAALFAINEVKIETKTDIPVMVSGTITDASGRTLSGQTPTAFWTSIKHANLFSVGLNCSLGADEMIPHIQELSGVSTCGISAHPNAGLPNEFGLYDQTPEEMQNAIKPFLEKGYINIIGGCCGTTPEHLEEIVNIAAKYKPRQFNGN